MFSKKSKNLFLRPDENIVYSFDYRGREMIATNHRLVIMSGGNTQDEFDYRYIAHMNLESRNNRRLLGFFFILLGLFYTASMSFVASMEDFGLSGGIGILIPIVLIALGLFFFAW